MSSRESSQPPTPAVTEKRSLAKPMLKRPNLSMRSKASVFPSPQDTIPASTGYLHTHRRRTGRDQEESSSSNAKASMSTSKTPDLSVTPPSELTTNLLSQSDTATSLTKVTCPEEQTEETSPQGPQLPHSLIDNKRELVIPTFAATAALTPTHTERKSIELEDEKVIKKVKLNDTILTPASPSPQSEPAPIPQMEPEPVQSVRFETQPESTQPMELELLQQRTVQQEELQSTPFKRSSSFAKKSTSHPKPNDRPLQELPAELPEMKLDRTPSQEIILDLNMKVSQKLSPLCPAQEPVSIIHRKYITSSVSSTETDENKEIGATNVFHPIRSSSRTSSGKERKVEASPCRTDAACPFDSPSQTDNNNLASIMSSISRKRSLLKKHR